MLEASLDVVWLWVGDDGHVCGHGGSVDWCWLWCVDGFDKGGEAAAARAVADVSGGPFLL